MNMKSIFVAICTCILGAAVGCDTTAIESEEEQAQVPVVIEDVPEPEIVSVPEPESIPEPESVPNPDPEQTIKYPDGIDPSQTSDDPTYGYTAANPIKVGGPEGFSGPSSEQLYLRHLRDSQFRTFSNVFRQGSMGGNPDEHIVDAYVLTDRDGVEITIYIDMYHPKVHPFHVKAPQGMYFFK